MGDIDFVRFHLASSKVPIHGAVVPIENGERSYLVAVLIKRDAEGKQRPSNRLLEAAQSELGEMGFAIRFVLRYEDAGEVEAGIRATILHSHGEHVRHVFASVGDGQVLVWVEPKAAISPVIKAQMESRVEEFLRLVGLELGGLSTTSESNLPSVLAIMDEIRIASPVTARRLAARLVERGFVVPSNEWLERRLDSMRKDGRVVWMKPALYSLTSASLHMLGTMKGRRSPDIVRLLALARYGG